MKFYIFFIFLILSYNKPLSKPLIDLKDIENNKYIKIYSINYRYLNQNPFNAMFRNDATGNNMTNNRLCPVNLDLLWISDVSASIHSTPIIYPLHRDGYKDV